MRWTALAAVMLVLVGCSGSASPTGQSQSPTPPSPTSSSSPNVSPRTSPSANPPPSGSGVPAPVAVSCTSQIPSGAKLALVVLAKGISLVVRDITDIAHPITRCMIYGGSFHRFVDATHVSYIVTSTDGQGALYVVDLRDSSDTLIRAWTNEGSLYWVYAWNPDGKALTYLSSNGDKVAWHVLSGGSDVMLSDLGSIPGRGVDPYNDDAMVGFSADGKYVALEQTFSNAGSAPGQPPFQIVRLSDHKLVYSRTDGTMATWAGNSVSLYFRTSAGVEDWDPTTGTRLAVPQGFRWIHPWPSADGKRIAYVDADAKGNHFPGYVRLSDGQAIRVSSRPRNSAAFLNTTLMWYAEEAVCSAQCGLGEPKLTGRTYIYDVVAKTESVSIITAFIDSWPRIA